MDVVVRNVLRHSVDLDEYTAEYIAQVLVDSEDQADESDLRDLLCGLLETLVEEGDVGSCVDDLLASRQAIQMAVSSGSGGEEANLGGHGRQVQVNGSEGVADTGRGACDKENDDSNSTTASTSTNTTCSNDARQSEGSEHVTALRSMFPNVDARYLERVFLWNNSNLEAAANDLLSKSEEELAAEMAKMRVEEVANGRTKPRVDLGAGLDAATKEAIKRNFLLEAVPGGKKQSQKNLKKNAEFLNAQIVKSKEAQVRFRDGVVASTKGQKFIIENTKEEWNGGSTGKVYTKGKRGKGFVG